MIHKDLLTLPPPPVKFVEPAPSCPDPFSHSRLRLGRQPDELRFQEQPRFLLLRRRGVSLHVDGRTVQEQPATERKGDQESIPRI